MKRFAIVFIATAYLATSATWANGFASTALDLHGARSDNAVGEQTKNIAPVIRTRSFIHSGRGDEPARLTLEADKDCYASGETVTVAVWMRDLEQTIVGGQFFLGYNKATLDFISAAPGDAPFTSEILNAVDEEAGTIDYAVGLTEGAGGTSVDTRMAILTFQALERICSAEDLVTFREHNPPSRLGDDQSVPVYPQLVNLDLNDITPPTATQGTIAACYDSLAEAEAAALDATTDLIDNCADTSELTKQVTASTGGCAASVTVTVADPCLNQTDYVYATRIDAEPPAATAGSIGECYATAAEAEAAAIAATTDPMDNCSAPPDITLTATTAGDCAAVVTVRVTDECGNYVEYPYETRIDGVAPTATQGTIEACYTEISLAEAAALAATTDLIDNCYDPVDLTKSASSTGDCDAVVTVRVADPCGNFTDYVFNTRVDAETPTATPGSIETCYTTAAEAEAAAIAATTDPTDNCSAPQDIMLTAATVGDCAAVVTVTVTDECGNFTEYAYDTRIDDTPPTAAPGTIGEFYQSVAAAEADALAATTDAVDNCSDPANLVLTASTSGTCAATVTVRVTDECGNYTDYAYPTRVDEERPAVTPPADLSVHADAGLCTAAVDPGQATAEDNCTTSLTVAGTRDDELALTDPYPQGTTTITWRTTDEAGNIGSAVQTVTVSGFNELLVDVELKAIDVPTLTRCITFEFYNCATSAIETVEQEVVFTNGTASGASVLVNCGAYDCIRCRDGLHTLWQTDTDGFAIAGARYVADFVDASGVGGANDALIGGNLFDDVPPYAPPQFIDIMDYAVFVNAWMADYGTGDTDCDTLWPHADINGDGLVGSADFTFIQTYFLYTDDPTCCAALAEGAAPRLSVSIGELRYMGLSELAIADLNRDGWIDESDVVAFLNGATPHEPPVFENPPARPDPDTHGNRELPSSVRRLERP